MTTTIYKQITSLQHERNEVSRSLYFEQLLREIIPWDHRPPVIHDPLTQPGGGLFSYQGISYQIGTVAGKATVTVETPEWIEFEQRLRKRDRDDIAGLFCCLYDVAPEVINAAKRLNKEGIPALIIFGGIWEKLMEADLFFPVVLDFLRLNSRTTTDPSIDSIEQVSKWIRDTTLINERLQNTAKKLSAPFLRRFKHKFHDRIFVERAIEKQIRQITEMARPTRLRAKAKKDNARQIIVLRDFSGSGKTTLSANFASVNDETYCFAFSAGAAALDKLTDLFFSHLNYPNNSVSELLTVDKPLLLIVDSLDETPVNLQMQKRKEIRTLLKKIDELNVVAARFNLSMFPIILMFTVREDYWRDWEAVFEGRQDVTELKKMISSFNSFEFQKALHHYEKAYDYSVSHFLNPKASAILSVPINLEIFSEANHFEGDISVADIWEGKILSSFFTKKEELINKHYITNFSGVMFYRLLGLLAFDLLENKTTLIPRERFNELVALVAPSLAPAADQILLQIVSEQIVINDTEDNKNYRFKYIRFIEYLAAFFIAQEVERTGSYGHVNEFIKVIYDSNIISIFSVFNNLKHICRTRYRDLEEELVNLYSRSATFLTKYLPELRGRVARSETISDEEIKTILTSNYAPNAFNSWHTFFIVAAKSEMTTREVILSSFDMAWENNRTSEKRWQLIQKLAKKNLLVLEQVLLTILKDGTPREWEEYLGQIINKNLHNDFMELWLQTGGEGALNLLTHSDPAEWRITDRLLDLIARNETFIPGDVMTDIPLPPYTIFNSQRSRKKIVVPEREKQTLDAYIQCINDMLTGVPARHLFPSGQFSEMSKEAGVYLNQELEETMNITYGTSGKPFLNHVLANCSGNYSTVKSILENKLLNYDLQGKDQQDRTALIELVEFSEHKLTFLELLYLRGYKNNPQDETYINLAITNIDSLDNQEIADLLIAYCFFKVKKSADLPKVGLLHKQIYALFCFRFGRIIHFKFPNMIQVLNNALEHYSAYEHLFIRALHVYGLFEEMNKIPSFHKKMAALKERRVKPNHDDDSFFETIFPLLFH